MLYALLSRRDAFKNHEKIQNEWTNVLIKTNNKLGRNVSDSVATKYEEHRIKREQAEAMEYLKSDEDRFGVNLWRVHLRQEIDPIDTKRGRPPEIRTATSVRERPTISLEMIRHPRPITSGSSSWRTSFFRTGLNTSSDRSIRKYMNEKVQINQHKLENIRASGENIESLMVSFKF